jgi:chemotaxis protein MotB
VGSANLTKPAREILLKLAKEIGKLPNFVEIEGHTDSRPYGSKKGYTNWELSTDRGNSARKILENSGLWEGQLQSVVGFADRKLRVVNNPFDLSNRRISILIRQIQASRFLQNN